MSVHGAQEVSLRLDRLETSRLAWAFALSIAVHLLAWGTYEAGRKYHVWEKVRVPAWIKALTSPKVARKETSPQDREPPLMFINVNPQDAVTEPPKDAKYYSSHSSKAANPEVDRETDIPKITGTQTQVAKTEDTPREKVEKLQPLPPAQQDQSEVKAKPTLSPGDLTMARPDLNPRTDQGDADRPRPRTLKEAMARRQMDPIPGRKMKQDGGVARRAQIGPMVDAKGTSFGAYDSMFIAAVSQRWYDLLEAINYDGYQAGKVVLQFHLNYDGRITDMKVVESTVGDMLSLLCQKAVQDPSPFEKWPREMRLMVGSDSRTIQFTFYYN